MSDACVDLVTGANVLHWIYSEELSKEIDRILKPGGWFIFYGWGAPRPRIEINDDTFIDEVRKEFKVGFYYVLLQTWKIYQMSLISITLFLTLPNSHSISSFSFSHHLSPLSLSLFLFLSLFVKFKLRFFWCYGKNTPMYFDTNLRYFDTNQCKN